MGTILNVFLNKLRDNHNTNELKAKLGDDNTPVSVGDTSLGNEIGEFTPITAFIGNAGEVTKIYQVNADELVGKIVREVGFETEELLQSREVVTAITKSANEVIQIRHKTTYRRV